MMATDLRIPRDPRLTAAACAAAAAAAAASSARLSTAGRGFGEAPHARASRRPCMRLRAGGVASKAQTKRKVGSAEALPAR